MDVGQALRRARTQRHLTLEQLANSTKISASTLDAIENNDPDRLPSMVYVRGFVRTYAHEVGLGNDIVDDYIAQFEPVTPVVEAPVAPPPAPRRAMGMPNVRVTLPKMPFAWPTQMPARVQAIAAAIATVIVLVGGSFAIFPMQQSDASSAAPAAPAQAAAAPTPAPAAAPAPAVPVPGEVMRFELSPKGPCWVSALSDRKSVLSRLMQPGEKETIEVRSELVLRVGDPASCTYSVDGKTGRPLGKPGEPVTVKITRENYKEFVAL
jgi:cytoskeleton protein RodZ